RAFEAAGSFLEPSPASWLVRRTLGSYPEKRLLGAGGMGHVYLAFGLQAEAGCRDPGATPGILTRSRTRRGVRARGRCAGMTESSTQGGYVRCGELGRVALSRPRTCGRRNVGRSPRTRADFVRRSSAPR